MHFNLRAVKLRGLSRHHKQGIATKVWKKNHNTTKERTTDAIKTYNRNDNKKTSKLCFNLSSICLCRHRFGILQFHIFLNVKSCLIDSFSFIFLSSFNLAPAFSSPRPGWPQFRCPCRWRWPRRCKNRWRSPSRKTAYSPTEQPHFQWIICLFTLLSKSHYSYVPPFLHQHSFRS